MEVGETGKGSGEDREKEGPRMGAKEIKDICPLHSASCSHVHGEAWGKRPDRAVSVQATGDAETARTAEGISGAAHGVR